jgi:hypothetical protein
MVNFGISILIGTIVFASIGFAAAIFFSFLAKS